MNPAPPAAKPARLAVDVAKSVPLSAPAAKLLAPALTPRQFFDLIAPSAALADDAIQFLAAALPKREAVWWGVLCAKDGAPKPALEAAKAIAAAEAWVKDPSETNRRAAESAANLAGYGTSAGCLAAAAFWSGGSLLPPHLPPTAPKDELTGTAVASSILLATIATPPDPATAKAKFIALGGNVAAGRNKWQ